MPFEKKEQTTPLLASAPRPTLYRTPPHVSNFEGPTGWYNLTVWLISSEVHELRSARWLLVPEPNLKNWLSQALAADALRLLAPVARALDMPLVPIKGVVLGRWLYEDTAERPLSDLDLLIRHRDREPLKNEIRRLGWQLVRDSEELRELAFIVGGVMVEAHAEVVRRDLTRLRVEDLLARATAESRTFGFEIRRLDDVDHTLLLLVELVKDWFVEANAHQPEDLERLLRRISHRAPDLIARAAEAGFTTGLHNAARWLAEAHHSEGFTNLLARVGPPPRRIQPFLVRQTWKARPPPRILGLGLSCWTNDRWSVRTRCLATIVRRGLWRAWGRDPR